MKVEDYENRVKNIYYMLSYAFQSLRQGKYKNCEAEKFDNARDLFAEILLIGVTKEIIRGLRKDYVLKQDQLSNPKGKFCITDSIKNSSLSKCQIVCEYDEFSINFYLNKIIKTTILLLIKSDISTERKKKLKSLMIYFSEVDEINPFTINWKINFDRNNQNYRMLIYICWLVIKGLIQTTGNGQYKINDYVDEQQMYHLYEKFILEFYKKEYPQLKVTSSHIKWALDDDNYEMLPIMQSDITLETSDKVLIIDAKYYTNAVSKKYDKNTLISNNLYQIFTYVKNKKVCGKDVSGVLLYAKTDELVFPNNSYSMSGNRISAKTLDLNCDFEQIKQQLCAIIEEHKMLK